MRGRQIIDPELKPGMASARPGVPATLLAHRTHCIYTVRGLNPKPSSVRVSLVSQFLWKDGQSVLEISVAKKRGV